MIYYPPQILFLLRARQLRSRSSIFFPFTAHRAIPRSCSRRVVSPFVRPLCSAPSLKVTDCLLYYPLVSIFTLLSEALPMSIVPGANSYGHNTVLRNFNGRIVVTVSSVRESFDGSLQKILSAAILSAENGLANNEARVVRSFSLNFQVKAKQHSSCRVPIKYR